VGGTLGGDGQCAAPRNRAAGDSLPLGARNVIEHLHPVGVAHTQFSRGYADEIGLTRARADAQGYGLAEGFAIHLIADFDAHALAPDSAVAHVQGVVPVRGREPGRCDDADSSNTQGLSHILLPSVPTQLLTCETVRCAQRRRRSSILLTQKAS